MKYLLGHLVGAAMALTGIAACDPYSMGGLGLDADTQKMIDMATRLGASGTTAGAPNASGEIAMSKGSAEAWSLPVQSCESGERRGFAGVDLAASIPGSIATLRVVVDPIDGPRARLTRMNTIGAKSWPLDKATCSVLDAKLTRDGMRINNVTVLEGTVNLDCTLEDGTNLVANVAFNSCHSSPDVETALSTLQAALEQKEVESALPIPEEVAWPTIPSSIKALKIHPTMRSVGTSIHGDDADHANAACLADTKALLTRLGLTVVDTSEADVEADFRCSGHVTFRDTATSIEVLLPKTTGPAVTLRAGSAEIDELPATSTALRCDIPGGKSVARTQACTQRIERWSDARFANWLAQSQHLLGIASQKGSREATGASTNGP